MALLPGVMLLWFILVAVCVAFVTFDIRRTPEAAVLKVAFVLITLFTGPVGAFLYVLGCREPLPGLHERYTKSLWRQTLGSTMHCVAGDGLGIVIGAVIAMRWHLQPADEMLLEYVLGFGLGWTIFQALFMKSGTGRYIAALRATFLPELLSMNVLMAAMLPVMAVLMALRPIAREVDSADFWFVMSMSLLAGFAAAYPVNWWLVSHHLKHGMMTVRPAQAVPPEVMQAPQRVNHAHAKHVDQEAPTAAHGIGRITALTFALLVFGVGASMLVSPM